MDAKAYAKRWTLHCRFCDGWGGATYFESHGLPYGAEAIFDVCDACQLGEIARCSRCSYPLALDEHGDMSETPCQACGWDFDDRAIEDEWTIRTWRRPSQHRRRVDMGTKNNPGEFDCYENAEPDEPMFVLLARDPVAADVVRYWIQRRYELRHVKPTYKDKLDEAARCAVDMDVWLSNRRARSTGDA